jgi:hypothetical protein
MALIHGPLGAALYGAGHFANRLADDWRRINYDPIVHNQVRLMHQGGMGGYDAALLAKILSPGSTYQNRSFDPIAPAQNANFIALLKKLGYLPHQAL